MSETASAGTNFVRPSAGETVIVMYNAGAGNASVTLTPAPLGATTGRYFYTFEPIEDPTFGLINGGSLGNAPVTIPVIPFTDNHSSTAPPDYRLFVGPNTVGGRVTAAIATYAIDLHFVGTVDYGDSQTGIAAVAAFIDPPIVGTPSWGGTKYTAFSTGGAQPAPYAPTAPVGTTAIPLSRLSHRFGFSLARVAPFNPNANITIPLHTYAPASAFSLDLAGDPQTLAVLRNWFNRVLTNPMVGTGYAAAPGAGGVGRPKSVTFNLGTLVQNYGFQKNALGNVSITGSATFTVTQRALPPADVYDLVFLNANLTIGDIFDFWYFNPAVLFAIPGVGGPPNPGPVWGASIQSGAYRAGIAPATTGEVTMVQVTFIPAALPIIGRK